MSESLSRRRFLAVTSLTMPAVAIGLHSQSAPAKSDSGQSARSSPGITAPGDLYPAQSPDMVREMVIVSHFNLTRVKELVGAHP